MSIDACAALVAKGDPDRFAATMTAPPALRARLLPLYAFNLEVARAPWVTAEPMIAEMRLQWWADAVAEIYDGRQVRRHEVVTPLASVIDEAGLDRAAFDALIEARRQTDIAGRRLEDMAALEAYIAATAGGLMGLSAQAAGGDADAVGVAQRFGCGSGAAKLLVALPALRANNRLFLPDTPDATVAALVEWGLLALRTARENRGRVPAALTPVFLCGWQADHVLARARTVSRVWDGALQPSEIRRRASLARCAITGRW